MASKNASFAILSASGLELLCGLVPQWLRITCRLLFRLSLGARFWGVAGKLLGASGEPSGASWGASGTSWGGFGELRGRLGGL